MGREKDEEECNVVELHRDVLSTNNEIFNECRQKQNRRSYSGSHTNGNKSKITREIEKQELYNMNTREGIV